MDDALKKLLDGYHSFREQYAACDKSVMKSLADHGQRPQVMVVACSDSRVDPALILQCEPGDLFVVRNVANIVPPYEKDAGYHGTSAALEFGIRFLQVKHLILLGHSQCGGIQSLVEKDPNKKTDFIQSWVSLVESEDLCSSNIDECVKKTLNHSYRNCHTFPWIKKRVEQGDLEIHRWFFQIKDGQVFRYSTEEENYLPLD